MGKMRKTNGTANAKAFCKAEQRLRQPALSKKCSDNQAAHEGKEKDEWKREMHRRSTKWTGRLQ